VRRRAHGGDANKASPSSHALPPSPSAAPMSPAGAPPQPPTPPPNRHSRLQAPLAALFALGEDVPAFSFLACCPELPSMLTAPRRRYAQRQKQSAAVTRPRRLKVLSHAAFFRTEHPSWRQSPPARLIHA